MEAVILTKSDMKKEKTGKKGQCVTAYDLRENRFVRFVSDTEGSPIPDFIANQFSLLDVVSVRVVRPCPLNPQTENLLVNMSSFSVVGTYQPGIEAIYHMIPPPLRPRLMDTPDHTLDSVDNYRHSLELLRVSNLRIARNRFGKDKAEFYFGSDYCDSFSMTDPRFYLNVVSNRQQKQITCLEIGNAYIALSIPTEPYIKDGKNYGYYKFVAAIYPVHEPDF